jgi:hypothetical protein
VTKDYGSQEQESKKADDTGHNRARKEEGEDGTAELSNTHGDPEHCHSVENTKYFGLIYIGTSLLVKKKIVPTKKISTSWRKFLTFQFRM